MVQIPGNLLQQSLRITILDDNIVEDREFVNLRLTTQTPAIVSVDQTIARIEISDNDGTFVSTTCQYRLLSYNFTITAALLNFEQDVYTFPEGSTGSVCLFIANNVTLDVNISLTTRFYGMSYSRMNNSISPCHLCFYQQLVHA